VPEKAPAPPSDRGGTHLDSLRVWRRTERAGNNGSGDT
jgi:hypothetical protein